MGRSIPNFDISHLDGRKLFRREADGRILLRRPVFPPDTAIDREHGFRRIHEKDAGTIGKALRYSHSRGSTFRDCNLKGWYSTVAALMEPTMAPMAIGTGTHEILDVYVQEEALPAVGRELEVRGGVYTVQPLHRDIAHGGLRLMPPIRGIGKLHAERWMERPLLTLEKDGVSMLYVCKIDLSDVTGEIAMWERFFPSVTDRSVVWTGDHKTRSSDRYAPDAEKLAGDHQQGGYARMLALEDPDTPYTESNPPERVAFSHFNHMTKGAIGKSWRVDTVVPWEQVERVWDITKSTARLMADLAVEGNPEKVPTNRGGCSKYGGCPYRGICAASPENSRKGGTIGFFSLLRGGAATTEKSEDTTMATPKTAKQLQAEKRARRKGKSKPAPVGREAPPEEKTAMATKAGASKRKRSRKKSAPVGKTPTGVAPSDRAPESQVTDALVRDVAQALEPVASAITLTRAVAAEAFTRHGLEASDANMRLIMKAGGFNIAGVSKEAPPEEPDVEDPADALADAEEAKALKEEEQEGVARMRAEARALGIVMSGDDGRAFTWSRLDQLRAAGASYPMLRAIDALWPEDAFLAAQCAGLYGELLARDKGEGALSYKCRDAARKEGNGVFVAFGLTPPPGWEKVQRYHPSRLKDILAAVPGLFKNLGGTGRKAKLALEPAARAGVQEAPQEEPTAPVETPKAPTGKKRRRKGKTATTPPKEEKPADTSTPDALKECPEDLQPLADARDVALAAANADPSEELAAAFRAASLALASTPKKGASLDELAYCAFVTAADGLFLHSPGVGVIRSVVGQLRDTDKMEEHAEAAAFIADKMETMTPRWVLGPWHTLDLTQRRTFTVLSREMQDALQQGMSVRTVKTVEAAPLMVAVDCWPNQGVVRELPLVLAEAEAAVLANVKDDDDNSYLSPYTIPYGRGRAQVAGYLDKAIQKHGVRKVLGTDTIHVASSHPCAGDFLALMARLDGVFIVRGM